MPQAPLEPGKPGPQIDLDAKSAGLLLSAAGRKLSEGADSIIWTHANSELEVIPAKLTLRTESGVVTVSIPVNCEQTGHVIVTVAFVVGTNKRPSGLMATTSNRVSGPAAIVSIWSQPLIAFAWGAVQELLQAVAAESGKDKDGAGLIPVSLIASAKGVRLHTMARHGVDRRPP